MGMTMTQKILAAHAGLDKVEAGQLINCKLDLVLGNDVTPPVAINEFEKAGFASVFDNGRIAMVMCIHTAVNNFLFVSHHVHPINLKRKIICCMQLL